MSPDLGAPVPPVAPIRPHQHELHGEIRDDPYFWLREKEDPEVLAFLEAENQYARAVLDPSQNLAEALFGEMLGRIAACETSCPYPVGRFLYAVRREVDLQYPVYLRAPRDQPGSLTPYLDLNILAEGRAFAALGSVTVSPDGNWLAYSADFTGFRVYDARLRDLTSGADVTWELGPIAGQAWSSDSQTLYFTREDPAKRSYQLWATRRDQGRSGETLLFQEDDERFRVSVQRSADHSVMFLTVGSHTTSEVWWRPAGGPAGEFRCFSPRRQGVEYYLRSGRQADQFLMLTNDLGPDYRLLEVARDGSAERELLPHRPGTLIESAVALGEYVVVQERTLGLVHFRVIGPEGDGHLIPQPDPIYAAELAENFDPTAKVVRFRYESPAMPAQTVEYDLEKRQRRVLHQDALAGEFDGSAYGVERLWATSHDGAQVPITLIARRDRPEPGPLLLVGYGSYGMPYPVRFDSARISLLDRGLAFAIAHIRGGGDLGKSWHDAGKMALKLNTFRDFEACARHLIDIGRTDPNQLAISGGSAGGLLMGAVVNANPSLYRAVLSYVPFVDVINTMCDTTLPLTVGEFEEWGNPAVEEQYAWMRAYCPYTNLQAGPYPAMLVRTSLHDSQVMYWEPAKYVARLRTLKTDHHPLLFLTNLHAGHGGNSGRHDALRDRAQDWAWMLGIIG